MQELINQLAQAIENHQPEKADQVVTHVLAQVKYPGKAYQMAFQLKSALKSVCHTPHHQADSDTQWFIKTEEENLVKCLQGE